MSPEEKFASAWAQMAKREGHKPKHKQVVEHEARVSDDLLARVVDAMRGPMSRAEIAAAVGATENHVRYAIRTLEMAGKVMRVAEPQPEKGRMIPDRFKLKGEQ